MWPWQVWLAGDENTEPSCVVLGFDFATYLTLAGSIHSGHCRAQALRYLLKGVEAIKAADAAGEIPEGEWGTVDA